MKTLFAGLLLLTLAACMPTSSRMQVSWGTGPWYAYCTWDDPCWYSDNRVFVYGWGYLERPSYVLLYENPGRRESWQHRRAEWHPRGRPQYRGRDWDAHKKDRDRDRRDHDRHDH